MCRGFQQNEREGRLKIKAFNTHLSISHTNININSINLPDILTLHFLPRINGTTLLEINGSTIRPDSPAFVTLHRILSKDGVIYGCRDRVSVCEGVRFEVYISDVKLLRGIFRKDDHEGQNWKLDCKCDDDVEGVEYAEVSVDVEGHVAVMSQKVVMMRRRMRRRCCVLEEIPEEREEGEGEVGSDVCGCTECIGGEVGMDGGDGEVGVEGVGWAVDVGIWVVCLGVGYLVSRASSYKRLRRRSIRF